MPIDPEKLQGGENSTEIIVRVSPDVLEVIRWLQFTDRQESPGEWLLDRMGVIIESEAPNIRNVLERSEFVDDERLGEVLEALDRLCPPEAEA